MMKKTLLLVLTIGFGLGLVLFWAGEGETGVSGSKHDPRVSPGIGATHVCESCHTPHGGTQGYPIWNRSRGHETTVFDMYASPSSDMPTGNDLLGYQSRLCLACHDGVLSTIVNAPGADDASAYNLTIVGVANLGTNMTNDHPVGFVFDSTLDTGGSGLSGLTVETTNSTTGITARIVGPVASFPLFAVGGQANTFQCATCHAVHHTPDVDYDPVTDGQVYFLRVSNAASQMCAQCHPNYN